MEEINYEPMAEVIEKKLCQGSHKVDGLPALLGDLHLDGRTCDCGRMIYKVEGCGCDNNKKELHGYPNEQ